MLQLLPHHASKSSHIINMGDSICFSLTPAAETTRGIQAVQQKVCNQSSETRSVTRTEQLQATQQHILQWFGSALYMHFITLAAQIC